MLRIPCPYCGLRDQLEFHCAGELRPKRPPRPDEVSDENWAEHQYYRKNTRGLHFERWVHQYGCRQWFVLERNTLTHEVLRSMTWDERHSGRSIIETP